MKNKENPKLQSYAKKYSELFYLSERLLNMPLSEDNIIKIGDWAEKYGLETVEYAIDSSCNKGIYNLNYIEKVLQSGIKPPQKIESQYDAVEIYSLLEGLFKNPNISLINTWVEEWHMSLLDIVFAYGKMMKHCDTPSFNYMAKIIENIHLNR